jgi:hypothetical protein
MFFVIEVNLNGYSLCKQKMCQNHMLLIIKKNACMYKINM